MIVCSLVFQVRACLHLHYTVDGGGEESHQPHYCHTEAEYGPKGSAVAARLAAVCTLPWEKEGVRERGRKKGRGREGGREREGRRAGKQELKGDKICSCMPCRVDRAH